MLSFLADILLPPASLAVLALVLLMIGGRLARRAALALTLLLITLAVPYVATSLLNSLAPEPGRAGPPPEAIVVLSADAVQLDGLHDLAPGPLTLDRIRAGAALARQSGLPVLVSGGETNATMTLAGMMAESFREDFRLPVRWTEERSRDTWENAAFSATILKPEGIGRVYLVTHFWHMRRAVLAFRAFGLDPVPAPVRPPYLPPFSINQVLLRPSAWYNTYLALHEWVGLAYYALRG